MLMIGKMFAMLGSKINLPIGFFLILFGVLMVVLLPNLGTIENKLGFETKASLQAKVDTGQLKLSTVLDDNKSLVDASDKKDQVQQAVLDTVVSKAKDETKSADVVTNIETKMKIQIAAVKQQPKSKANLKVNKTEVSVETQLAQIHISAIWETYCEFNTDPVCENRVEGV